MTLSILIILKALGFIAIGYILGYLFTKLHDRFLDGV